jgi:glycerol-3-phosphate dehydrogenase subunit C
MGQKTRELLEMVPETRVTTVERCAGHDGTWGVKSEFFEQSMKIGRPVFRLMGDAAPDYISSDCAIAGRHIQQGMSGRESGDSEAGRDAEKQHPITLIRIAYGL